MRPRGASPATPRDRRSRAPWLATVLIAATALRCTAPTATQLLVAVSTIPAEGVPLDTVEIEVRSEDDLTTYDTARFVVGGSGADGGHFAPLSFGVAPRGDNLSGRFRVVARGLWTDAAGSHRIEVAALTSFVARERLLLPLTLDVRCDDDLTCSGPTTCSDDGCVPVQRDAATLRALGPGEEAPTSTGACGAPGAACVDRCTEGARVAVARTYSAADGYIYRVDPGDLPVQDRAAFYLYPDARADLLPFYECRFSNGRYFYSSSRDCEGNAENVALLGYLLPQVNPGRCDSVPLYRLYRDATRDHVYTTSADERDAFRAAGYLVEHLAGYVWTGPSTP